MIPADPGPNPPFYGEKRFKKEDLQTSEYSNFEKALDEAVRNLCDEKFDLGKNKKFHVKTIKYLQDKDLQILCQKLRSIFDNARSNKVTATQTDPGITGCLMTTVKLADISTTENVPTFVKNSEDLQEQILDIVRQKLRSKDGIQKALRRLERQYSEEKRHMEANLKKEYEIRLNNLEESLRSKMDALKEDYENKLSEAKQRLSTTKEEMRLKVQQLEEAERRLRVAQVNIEQLGANNRILENENQMYKRYDERRYEQSIELTKCVSIIEDLRAKLKKAEDSNKIIIREFRKMELERDELIDAVNDGIRHVDRNNSIELDQLIREIEKTENLQTAG